MSRLIESTLTAKISRSLLEGEETEKVNKKNAGKEYELIHADSNKISELENGSAFTWEGITTTDNDLKGITEFFKENTKGFKTPVKMYTWSGKEFNDKYNLTGDNAYPDDLTFLSIPLDSWSEMGNLPMVKLQVGARWLDDIVDNNARREGRFDEGCKTKLDESRPGYNNAEKIADFIMSYDPYEVRNVFTTGDPYLGNDDNALKGRLIVAIETDSDAAKNYIQQIIDENEGTEEQVEEAKKIIKLFEKPVNESDKPKKLKEDSYTSGIFKEIEEALIDAGFNVERFSDSGTLTYNLGWDVSKDGNSTQLQCNGSHLSVPEDEIEDAFDGTDFLVNSVEVDGNTAYVNISAFSGDEELTRDIEIDISGDIQEAVDKWIANHSGPDSFNESDESIKRGNESIEELKLHIKDLKQIINDEGSVDENLLKQKLDAMEELLDTYKSQMNESVSVVAQDGSTVDTDDAASVSINDNTVSVTNGVTTVTITSNEVSEPVEEIPVDDTEVPVEEPSEEIQDADTEVEVQDEIIEPTDEEAISQNTGIENETELNEDEEVEDTEEVETTNEPIEDKKFDSNETDEDIDVVDVDSLEVIKNQGNVYMLQLNQDELYYVCEDFDANKNEGNNASLYHSKEEADADYFNRVGLDTEENS